MHPGRIDLGLGRFDLHRILRLVQGTARSGGARPPPPETRVVDGLVVPAPGRFVGDPSLYVEYATMLGFRADDAPPDYDAQVGDLLAWSWRRRRRTGRPSGPRAASTGRT